MRRAKLFLTAIVCLLFVALTTAPSPAWELKLTGSLNWYYEYFNQMGSQGFFGPYNIDNGAGTATGNLNFWWEGPHIAQNLATGASAGGVYLYVIMDPVLTINPAINLKARYRLGQWNNPMTGYYNTWDAPGAFNGFSEGQWTMFWAEVSLPWGTLGVGKRPWIFGNGLQYDGMDGLTTESVVLSGPYGPLDIGIGFYPHRPVHTTGGPPFGFDPGFVVDPYDLVAAQYFNIGDKSGSHIGDILGFVVYNNGPLQAGILAAFANYHIGPEAPLTAVAVAAPPPPPPPATALPLAQESQYTHGTVFAKYNNGRFFFNAEAAWLYWTDRLSGAGILPGVITAAGFVPTPRYTEQWRVMAESGVLCGPAKLSFLSVWSPGPDRRAGALIDRQSAAFVWHPTFDTFLANYDVFRPYSYLLSYVYGSGFNAYDLSNDGYMRDSWVLATRFDYAVAANLNLFGTFMWAERTSNGYGWGCISPAFPAAPTGNVAFAINGAAGSPNIPDRALGWEVDAGFSWKLLEGFTTNFTIAYWAPGKWFNYACIDRSILSWNVPTAANFFGTLPDKKIDPIVGVQANMIFSF
jgi:hypothetical protein